MEVAKANKVLGFQEKNCAGLVNREARGGGGYPPIWAI